MYNLPDWEWRKVVRGINNPAPQPKDLFQKAGPGYEEDPDVGIELEEGVFYQACRGCTLVAIVADYPGLIPSSSPTRRAAPASGEVLKRKMTTISSGPSNRRNASRTISGGDAGQVPANPAPGPSRVNDNSVPECPL